MANMAEIYRSLTKNEVVRLTRAGFTVSATAVTGGTDARFWRVLAGGKSRMRLLKRRLIRA